MLKHDFSSLYQHYPSIIAQMPETFSSHEFILRLAQQHQKLYVEALYSYRDSLPRGEPAPFRFVHSILARRLTHHRDLVKRIGDKESENVFRNTQTCAEWKKL